MEYVPIRLNTIRPECEVSFDVFIKIGPNFIHYIKKEDAFDSNQINKLKSKGVKKLFIDKNAENQYLDYLDSALNLLSDEKVTGGEKANIVHDSMVTSAENAKTAVRSEKDFNRTENQMDKVIQFLMKDSGALKSILSAAGTALDDFHHSANVASLSLGLAKELGITDSRELLDLGLAALLHDIGISKLDLDPKIDRSKMTSEQNEKFRSHVDKAIELISDKPFINPKIVEMIQNHEELGQNAGYPGKKNLLSLPVTCQILSLCNHYDRFCQQSQKSLLESSKAFFLEKVGMFDLKHLEALKKIL